MKIVCISDTHGQPVVVPDGDMVIHAGDVSSEGRVNEVIKFLKWFSGLPHKYKICIAGNHDFLFQRNPLLIKSLLVDYPGITYLEQSSCEIEGIKIFGSPWTPKFFNWAFMYARQDANDYWEKIPPDTNILITHGPPYGILDLVDNNLNDDKHVGCKSLLRKLDDLPDLKLHVFGHIHSGRGELYNGKTFINAACLDEDYLPVRVAPFIFNYDYDSPM